MIERKFKEGDRCRVINNYFDHTFESMIGKIVTIDQYNDFAPNFYYIKEKYWYI